MDHAKRSFLGLSDQTGHSSSDPFNNAAPPLRPPWSLTEELFLDACTTCGACITACPEQILLRGGGGFPTVDFARGECTFCHACLESCNDDALKHIDSQHPWPYTAAISESCLPASGVACQSCQDICEPRAIKFQPRIGGPSLPSINLDSCNACGACVSICPSEAITIIDFQ